MHSGYPDWSRALQSECIGDQLDATQRFAVIR